MSRTRTQNTPGEAPVSGRGSQKCALPRHGGMTQFCMYKVQIFLRRSISATVVSYSGLCVCCVDFCCSFASGLNLTQGLQFRLFVWVLPGKHTARSALCTRDYSWLWPQFSSGLLPGSVEVSVGKPQSCQSPGRSQPQCTTQPPQWPLAASAGLAL